MAKDKRSKESEVVKHRDTGLAHVDIVPAEEFISVEPSGEQPEWAPGDLRSTDRDGDLDADKNGPDSSRH